MAAPSIAAIIQMSECVFINKDKSKVARNWVVEGMPYVRANKASKAHDRSRGPWEPSK